jgi:serine/threonine protein kinase
MSTNPAQRLEGITLEGGWVVQGMCPKNPQATGGNFSQCYLVRSSQGEEAFLKALDFYAAFENAGDTTDVIERITALFNFERDLLGECGRRNMDRVVRAIASGMVRVEPGNPFALVPYLILEKANADIRIHLDDPKFASSLYGKLRAIHHVATGLKQLHGANIAHQDLKPSNVLIFYVDRILTVSKVADLGRASRNGFHSPHDELSFAGDMKYAPPEVLYSHVEPDWASRRIAADLYMLGSLVSFIFSKTTSMASLLHALPISFWPAEWGSSFDDVLPYLHNAFTSATELFAESIPPQLRRDLIPTYSELCNPDPRNRGVAGVLMNRNALERFVTRFDLMASRARSGKYD